jgi:hypothetical protein
MPHTSAPHRRPLEPHRAVVIPFFAALAIATATTAVRGEGTFLDRLSPDLLDVTPPTARVTGTPGTLKARPRECRTMPLAAIRRRVVDLAVQEWGFFGFSIRDEEAYAAFASKQAITLAGGGADGADLLRRSFFPRLSVAEATRVAPSVAGYWAVTPEATMMIARQNASWREPDAPRRADPWSAAFISWVMCEAGLGSAARFQRAIAHHAYIDQAIRARLGAEPQAAFVAYDGGEAPIAAGDLLCASRRPVYRSLVERRRQMGVGARTHCDIVVSVDEAAGRIAAIGGNVGRAVSLKLLRAGRGANGHLQATSVDEGRPVFAHLKLRSASIEARALDATPTIEALGCTADIELRLQISVVVPGVSTAARHC